MIYNREIIDNMPKLAKNAFYLKNHPLYRTFNKKNSFSGCTFDKNSSITRYQLK